MPKLAALLKKLVARLDPCVNWFKLLARTKGRILWIFPALLFVGYLVALHGGSPAVDFLDLLRQRNSNSSLLTEARSLNLDYEQVLANPRAYVGKPVAWCVSTRQDGSYVSDRPAWPVALKGPFDFEEYRSDHDETNHCLDVLAVIAGFERGLIQLHPLERL